MDVQTQGTSSAMDRLVHKTEFEHFGWTRVGPLPELFKKYNVNPNDLELDKIQVYHRKCANGRMTFQDALGQNMLIVVPIFCNTLSSTTDNYNHDAVFYVVLFCT
mgnify:CR=1 FL=1